MVHVILLILKGLGILLLALLLLFLLALAAILLFRCATGLRHRCWRRSRMSACGLPGSFICCPFLRNIILMPAPLPLRSGSWEWSWAKKKRKKGQEKRRAGRKEDGSAVWETEHEAEKQETEESEAWWMEEQEREEFRTDEAEDAERIEDSETAEVPDDADESGASAWNGRMQRNIPAVRIPVRRRKGNPPA